MANTRRTGVACRDRRRQDELPSANHCRHCLVLFVLCSINDTESFVGTWHDHCLAGDDPSRSHQQCWECWVQRFKQLGADKDGIFFQSGAISIQRSSKMIDLFMRIESGTHPRASWMHFRARLLLWDRCPTTSRQHARSATTRSASLICRSIDFLFFAERDRFSCRKARWEGKQFMECRSESGKCSPQSDRPNASERFQRKIPHFGAHWHAVPI
jgi:hypothetical protein